MVLLTGPRYIFFAKSNGSRKALPYLSSLVTLATPTLTPSSCRYISLVIPKANSSFVRLSLQFSAANDWNELQKSLKLETYISAAICSPFVNSPSNQLPTSSPYLFLFFCSFAHQHLYLHILICTPVFNS